MSHAQRLRAMRRLRKAAERAVGAPDYEVHTVYKRGYSAAGIVSRLECIGTRQVQSPQYRRLENAWRAFPECERDEVVPPPHEVLAICERMEREQAADDAFCELLKHGRVEGVTTVKLSTQIFGSLDPSGTAR